MGVSCQTFEGEMVDFMHTQFVKGRLVEVEVEVEEKKRKGGEE